MSRLIHRRSLATLAFCCALSAVMPSPMAQALRLDVNDVAYLWPPPGSVSDVGALIAGGDVLDGTDSRLWPREAFESLLQTAQATSVTSSAGAVFHIDFAQFSDEFKRPETWKVVGFRVDGSAPGSHPSLIAQFGSTPQIRLVLQPVTVKNGVLRVHDVTVHLVYSFVNGIDAQTRVPTANKAVFADVVNELVTLKRQADAAGAATGGPLRVHPALQGQVPEFAANLRRFLKRRLAQGQLSAMAFMGIDPPEPWIFFAMVRRPTDGAFVQVGTPQMLTFRGGSHVTPSPPTTNLGANLGVSTAVLFTDDVRGLLGSPVIPGVAHPLHSEIPDVIANPRLATALNTDCVSCHTESRRRSTLQLSSADSSIAFHRSAIVSGVDPGHLPQDDWNVRNFGWFPGRDGAVHPTVSMRTANEAMEAVEFLNTEYLGAGASPVTQAQNNTRGLERPVLDAVANPLTLVMNIKSPGDFAQLKALIDGMQGLPPEQNPIRKALTKLSTVHFARFVFLSERQLAVITTYDGDFADYIDGFVNTIGPVFDQLLAHMADAPPLPVSDHRADFLDYVRKNDLKAIPPFYSAYPHLKVLDILTLDKERRQF